MKELNLNSESMLAASLPTKTSIDGLGVENDAEYEGEGRSKEHFDVWE